MRLHGPPVRTVPPPATGQRTAPGIKVLENGAEQAPELKQIATVSADGA